MTYLQRVQSSLAFAHNGKLTLDNPLFPAFFRAVACKGVLGDMSGNDLSRIVEKPWNWTAEFEEWARLEDAAEAAK